jgi:hypothetical protein
MNYKKDFEILTATTSTFEPCHHDKNGWFFKVHF